MKVKKYAANAIKLVQLAKVKRHFNAKHVNLGHTSI